MFIQPIQLCDVVYNAATQSFEGTVIIRDGGVTRKYACGIDAPITTSFEDAAEGLATQAQRLHLNGGGIFSDFAPQHPAPRAGRAKFEPFEWLQQIARLPGQNAA